MNVMCGIIFIMLLKCVKTAGDNKIFVILLFFLISLRALLMKVILGLKFGSSHVRHSYIQQSDIVIPPVRFWVCDKTLVCLLVPLVSFKH